MGVLSLCCACGGGSEDPDPIGKNPVVNLVVSPETVHLISLDGSQPTQTFSAIAMFADGSQKDVSELASFSLANGLIGSFEKNDLRVHGVAAGKTSVRVGWDGAEGTAALEVDVNTTRVVDGVADGVADLFSAATDSSDDNGNIVYPSDGTIFPRNLSELDIHWLDFVNGVDVFEVHLAADGVDIKVYQAKAEDDANYLTFTPEEWRVLEGSLAGKEATVTVRGLDSENPLTSYKSAPIHFSLTTAAVEGGLYYWAARSSDGTPGGIYRHDFGKADAEPEPYYTTEESFQGRCVACHVISRDGTKMAVTFDGGNAPSTILDVATREMLVEYSGSVRWNFAAYFPDGESIVTSHSGILTLRDGTSAASFGVVDTEGKATHPDISAQGDQMAFVRPGSFSNDWTFTNGAIMVQAYDKVAGAFGAIRTLVSTAAPINNYYPSFSPDGEWVAFSRSRNNAYDDSDAELWMTKADGSMEAFELSEANVGNDLSNSWTRWAPFEQVNSPAGGDTERIFWITFSSRREFGVRLGKVRPQIWMAPFFPDRAALGLPATAPAFRLPFQGITTSNHIAQWTEQIVPIE